MKFSLFFSLLMISILSGAQTQPISPQLQQQVQQIIQQQTAATAKPAGPPEDETHAKVKATPRLLRDSPVPQVFFEEINDTYYLPTSADYNRIMNALSTGLQKKIPISLIVNKKTKLILDVDTTKLPPTGSGSLYDDIPEDTSKNGAAAASGQAGAPNGAAPAAPAYVPFGTPAPVKPPSGWSQ
jgi:hypothetical protein